MSEGFVADGDGVLFGQVAAEALGGSGTGLVGLYEDELAGVGCDRLDKAAPALLAQSAGDDDGFFFELLQVFGEVGGTLGVMGGVKNEAAVGQCDFLPAARPVHFMQGGVL